MIATRRYWNMEAVINHAMPNRFIHEPHNPNMTWEEFMQRTIFG